MGLLQGPRLMAWVTKNPIRGNHWVPLGFRALLGSVKSWGGGRWALVAIAYFLYPLPLCYADGPDLYQHVEGGQKLWQLQKIDERV